MKKNLFSFGLFFSMSLLFSQQTIKPVSNAEYDLLKSKGKLDASVRYTILPAPGNNINSAAKKSMPSVGTNSTTNCSCLIPLDTTFSTAPFTNGVAPDYRSDDGSTNAIALPFSFCMYGVNYSSIYINNNGNISFVNSSPVFSSTGFPNSTDVMIAPFWADVDSRNASSGIVHYKINPTNIIVKWENVGYYAQHVDKLNSFQLILTDGNDSIIPAGNNVAFCYGDMQWTAGDASSGVGGIGGVAATVGVNKGDGINYYEVGRFDALGYNYAGDTLNSGVDFLDNKSVYFDACSATNTPATAFDSLCDTIPVQIAFNSNFNFDMIAFEKTQNLSYTVIHSPAGLTLNQSGSGSWLRMGANYTPQNPGIDSLVINYQDDGFPAKTNVYKKYFNIDATLSVNEIAAKGIKIFPNPTSGMLHFSGYPAGIFVKVFSSLGTKVFEKRLSTEESFDFSNLPKGVYTIQLSAGDGVATFKKFIIE